MRRETRGSIFPDLIFSGPDPKFVVFARKFIESCVLWEKIGIILNSTGRQMSEALGENNWNKLVLWQKRLFGKETKTGLLKT